MFSSELEIFESLFVFGVSFLGLPGGGFWSLESLMGFWRSMTLPLSRTLEVEGEGRCRDFEEQKVSTLEISHC